MLLRNAEKFEKVIEDKKTGFIAASPLSRGLLGGKDYSNLKFSDSDVRKKWGVGEQQNEWYKSQQEKLSKLKELSLKWNVPLKKLAIAYVISGKIMTAIPGMKSEEDVNEILDSLSIAPLDKEKIEMIREL